MWTPGALLLLWVFPFKHSGNTHFAKTIKAQWEKADLLFIRLKFC